MKAPKAFWAATIIGIVFLSSALLLSLFANYFSNADLTRITGTIVLRDSDTPKPLSASVSLPGANCEIKATNCGGTFWMWDTVGPQYNASQNFGLLNVNSLNFPTRKTSYCQVLTTCVNVWGSETTFNIQTASTVETTLSLLDNEFKRVYDLIYLPPIATDPNYQFTITHELAAPAQQDISGADKYIFTMSWKQIVQNSANSSSFTSCLPGGVDICNNPPQNLIETKTEAAYIVYDPTTSNFKGGFNPSTSGSGVNTFCYFINQSVPGGTYLLNAENSYHTSIAYSCQ